MIPTWLTLDLILLLGKGVGLTIALTIITTILSVIIGLGVGSLRLGQQRWIRWPATLFIEFFRNIPALVLIIFWAFAFPNAFATETRQLLFFNNPFINTLADTTGLLVPWYGIAAILGLTLNTAAYIAELFRAGVQTIAQEQVAAAQTMGASTWVVFRRILIPGGVRAAYPAITSRLIHNLKNTALASFVSVPEFFNSIETAITRSFLAIEFLTIAAIIYLALSISFSAGLQRLEALLYPTRKVSAS
ncbi:MAG: ABC transporter permease subunit [Chloroflexota bacterium]